MRTLFFIVVVAGTLAASAQNIVDYPTFEERVLKYSETLGQSKAERVAVEKAMQVARTAFFPAVDATGNYQYNLKKGTTETDAGIVSLKHDTYHLEVGVLQPVYAGGSLWHNYKAAQIRTAIADKAIDLTTDNLIYSAKASYWGTVAQKEMYLAVCEYVNIIKHLTDVLNEKYADGYIAKTDLLQMQTRLKEAELQRLGSYQTYQVALQNMNVLMGYDPMQEVDVKDSISAVLPMPPMVSDTLAFGVRPELAMSALEVEYQKRQVSLAVAKYNPSLSVGFKERWGTSSVNINGSMDFSGYVYATLSVPIFHWGARFKERAAQRAVLLSKQYALSDVYDQISREVAEARTNLTEDTRKIAVAEENMHLASENLELNTFSYNEGRLTILDVLSAQLTWIQSYTSLIQAYYDQKLSLAVYQKVIGERYWR